MRAAGMGGGFSLPDCGLTAEIRARCEGTMTTALD
jgi:hypothetical protein